MKNILVTGIAGFIGSQLAKSLLNDGYSVTGIDNFKTGFNENIPSGAKFIEGDCGLADTYTHTLLEDAQFDFIVHLAGQSSGEVSFDDPVQDLSDNCASTLQLLKFARNISCTKFIFASSMSVYGKTSIDAIKESHILKPLSCYGNSKLSSEHYLRILGKNYNPVILRLFNVYGPGQNMKNLNQGMVSIYLAQALEKNKIIVKGSNKRSRDFIFIDDVINIWFKCLINNFERPVTFNVGTGVNTTVKQLLELITSFFPSSVVEFRDGTPGDQDNIYSDNSFLKSKIKYYDFVNLKEGLEKFIDYNKKI